MTKLPTGLYQPGKSILHKLDPFVKLISFLILIIAIVLTKTTLGYVVLLGVVSLSIYLSKIRVADALQSVENLKWFFLLIFLMNLSFYAPEDAWISLFILNPSYAGLVQGIQVIARVILCLILSNILTITTSPMLLMKAIELLFSPLKLFHLPTAQIAMILSVAIQFIPTLMEETETIRKAQMARGARFDSPRFGEKARAVMPLIIPIFISAFQRADELALAMEARGYRTDRSQTRNHAISFHWKEFMIMVSCIGICMLQIYLCL